MIVRESIPADIDKILQLLHDNALPSDDIDNGKISFTVIEVENAVAACGALENLSDCCLLRSVAVEEQCRNQGYAKILTTTLLKKAEAESLGDVYLLTNDADEYFVRQGFVRIQREAAPLAIQQSRQFSQLCPDSAILMKYAGNT